ncbi:hypothetical protein LCGC14_0547270 [marine sediment metagenome]|uniref:Uncharacterized protein n=1 Tax=marine sediment metagenome TaxID=412755 RepID=A0A0F9RR20_9ZZZZ
MSKNTGKTEKSSKILSVSNIDASDEDFWGDGFHNWIDEACSLNVDCAPNVVVRITVERIEIEQE